MNRHLIKRLVLVAVVGTTVSMVLMVLSFLWPTPLLLVLVMSIGQGVGLLALALYLLAIVLDLQTSGGGYLPEAAEEAAPPTPEA